MNETTETPNADALEPARMKIGPFSCRPFTLQTLIILEAIGSPLVHPVALDENGNAVPRNFGMQDIADAIWVFCNWDRPDILLLIEDKAKLRNIVMQEVSSKIDMAYVPVIQKDLAAVFKGVTESMRDAGLDDAEGDGEKKGGTGPLE